MKRFSFLSIFLYILVFIFISTHSSADQISAYEERIQNLEDRLDTMEKDKLDSVQAAADFIDRLNMELDVAIQGVHETIMMIPEIPRTLNWTPLICISIQT